MAEVKAMCELQIARADNGNSSAAGSENLYDIHGPNSEWRMLWVSCGKFNIQSLSLLWIWGAIMLLVIIYRYLATF